MLLGILSLGVSMLLTMGAPALALGATSEPPLTLDTNIPADVRDQFAGTALREAAAVSARLADQLPADQGPPPLDLSGTITSGQVHQLYLFTEEFTEGDTAAPPVEAQQEWIASIQRDGKVIGTLRVFKPDGGPARLAVSNGNVELGQALDTTPATALVEVPWTRSFYTVVDDVVTPVNKAAQAEVPSAADLDDVQDAVVDNAEENAELAADIKEGAVVGGSSAVITSRTLASERSDAIAYTGLGAASLGLTGLVILRRPQRGVNADL